MNCLSKQELKSVKRYKRKKYRQQDGFFLAEGTKLVTDILQSKIKPKFIIISEEWKDKNTTDFIDCEIKYTDNARFKKLSSHKNPEGILALCPIPKQGKVQLDDEQLILALDFLQDPGNMGTILRIADWFGIQTVICSTNTTDAYSPKVVQASMGSIARVNVHYLSLQTFFEATTLPVYGATLSGSPVYQMKAEKPAILVIGNESNGISDGLKKYLHAEVTIPKLGRAESLNAGVATGILVSHMLST